MREIKDKRLAEKIEKNPTSKKQFETVLKKACQPIKKPKSSPKQSKT